MPGHPPSSPDGDTPPLHRTYLFAVVVWVALLVGVAHRPTPLALYTLSPSATASHVGTDNNRAPRFLRPIAAPWRPSVPLARPWGGRADLPRRSVPFTAHAPPVAPAPGGLPWTWPLLSIGMALILGLRCVPAHPARGSVRASPAGSSEGRLEFRPLTCSITNPDACDVVQLEIMYLDSLRMYYGEGTPVIDDALYDQLRQELRWQGSLFPTFRRDKVEFLQRALQYARGKPAMPLPERLTLKALLGVQRHDADTLGFLAFLRVLRQRPRASPPLALQIVTGERGLKSTTLDDFQRRPGPKILLTATRSASRAVTDEGRPEKSLRAYLSLPPSHYSTNVLRARSVVRVGEATFRVELEGVDFLGVEVTPVLTAEVVVDEAAGRSQIDVTDCHLKGRRAEPEAQQYVVTSRNCVTWEPSGDPSTHLLTSRSTVQVGFLRPKWFLVPTRLAERLGTAIVQKVLDRTTDDFLATLELDYRAWACDDPSRTRWLA